jgi:hypothetical protein
MEHALTNYIIYTFFISTFNLHAPLTHEAQFIQQNRKQYFPQPPQSLEPAVSICLVTSRAAPPRIRRAHAQSLAAALGTPAQEVPVPRACLATVSTAAPAIFADRRSSWSGLSRGCSGGARTHDSCDCRRCNRCGSRCNDGGRRGGGLGNLGSLADGDGRGRRRGESDRGSDAWLSAASTKERVATCDAVV